MGSVAHSDVGKSPNQSEFISSDKMEIACEISPLSSTVSDDQISLQLRLHKGWCPFLGPIGNQAPY